MSQELLDPMQRTAEEEAPLLALAQRREPDPAPIVRVPSLPLSLLPVQEMEAVLKEYTDRRKAFRVWLLGQMEEGVHFGYPPGCSPTTPNEKQWKPKQSLYKAGAQLICDLLRMRATFETDKSAWEMLGSQVGVVVKVCKLINDGSPFFTDRPIGAVLGEGAGAGQAGKKGRDANAAVKIADKCAMVAAVINATGLSDLFSQDLEDLTAPNPAPDADPDSPKVPTREQRQNPPLDDPNKVTPRQLNALMDQWAASVKPPQKTLAAFSAWAKATLRTESDMTKLVNWTLDAVTACEEAL